MGSIITKQTNLRKPTTTTKGSKSSSAWSSPRTHSKQLLKLLSDKAYLAVAGKKKTTDEDPYEQVEEVEGLKEEEEEEREGVWKKSILMGEKCQPLDYSGVIYYDNNGHRLSHVPPRSPRASPFPGRSEAY